MHCLCEMDIVKKYGKYSGKGKVSWRAMIASGE
jgi:hypothetical protein